MATANLNNDPIQVLAGNDNIVIVDNFQSIRGGRTLDVTGYTPTVLNAGHVVIRDTEGGDYKPMPLNGGGDAYATLPENHEYAGILIASISTSRPFAGIMVRGTVNYAASPFPLDTILAELKTALPLIDFRKD